MVKRLAECRKTSPDQVFNSVYEVLRKDARADHGLLDGRAIPSLSMALKSFLAALNFSYAQRRGLEATGGHWVVLMWYLVLCLIRPGAPLGLVISGNCISRS